MPAEGWLSCRPIRVASTMVVIESTDPAVVRRFDELLAAMPDGDGTSAERPDGELRNPGTAPVIDIRVATVGPADGNEAMGRPYELWLGKRRAVQSLRLWRSEDELLTNLNRWALDYDGDRIHVHAG